MIEHPTLHPCRQPTLQHDTTRRQRLDVVSTPIRESYCIGDAMQLQRPGAGHFIHIPLRFSYFRFFFFLHLFFHVFDCVNLQSSSNK
ncbi:unnamed protein product [Brugia pahangi]|uniref:Uncharacterized protein n=1 Tax=Brugia pahangi TaxID=6280 RepID=A0A0N4TYP8_BRUPA|nr:unnamed protein product [Brugia pahangi]